MGKFINVLCCSNTWSFLVSRGVSHNVCKKEFPCLWLGKLCIETLRLHSCFLLPRPIRPDNGLALNWLTHWPLSDAAIISWVLNTIVTWPLSVMLFLGEYHRTSLMSHYLSQWWPWHMSPYGVTRPQWVDHNSSQLMMALCTDIHGSLSLDELTH